MRASGRYPARPSRRPALVLLAPALLVSAALTSGCGGEEPGTGRDLRTDDLGVETWALSDAPDLEIGVVEGDPAYQLHRASGSLQLADGRIVVLDGGNQQLRFFDASGRSLMTVGTEGDGPGEFRYPTRLRLARDGSLMVWDQALQRTSQFDHQGAFLRSAVLQPTPEVMFPGDEWLFDRFWIDSPVPPEARGAIRRALEAITVPDTLSGLLFVRVTPGGRLWISAVRPPSDGPVAWTVRDMEGNALARVETPARFEPHEIAHAYVLGRYMDELDVNYIRRYRLDKPAGSPAGPGLDHSLSDEAPTPAPRRTQAEEEALAPLRSVTKSLASLQEIHYSEAYSYTTDLEVLFSDPRFGLPDGVRVQILFADDRGWMGTVTDEASGQYCALAYGFYIPMGWSPGTVVCP